MFEEQPNGATEFATLRELLVGPERQQLDALADRMEEVAITPSVLADQLPEAIALRASRDGQLGRALAPTIETALRESIRRNPREVASAIFPVLGPAIRKAIAETMAGLVRSINSAVEHSFSVQGIKWRIEAWRTGERYADVVIKHALVYRVEQVFLVHAETGLLLAHVTAPDLDVPDADLISGMLTAIQDFVRDSFRPAEGGMLSTFTVGEHTVHVEAGPRALVAAVIRGQCPETVPQRLQQSLEQIHLEYASQLGEFEGDAAPFASAATLLDDHLETVLSTDRAADRAPRAWLRWAIPLAAIALLIGGFATASWLRWRRAVRLMEAEPGFVVIDASRSWRRWEFRGLKDPIAREPRAVLAALGSTPPTIAGQWKPYISLDSAMVVARARQALAAPASATTALVGDTLRVAGSATVDWLRRLRGAPAIGGVAHIDPSAVRATLPARIDDMRRRVETTRILFAPGSASVTDAEAGKVRALAESMRRLSDSVAAIDATVRVDLVGRTDPTGTDATNQSLATLRVDAVLRRLRAAGVPAAMLKGRPVATAQPLRAADAEEEARINRSVSFEAAAVAGSQAPRGP
ncbi:MAG TPA: OmpA family protein [Gemmatimonadaceae bacterium]|nr:OmpA family protein [Gemmatimonadaceae bacterium]